MRDYLKELKEAEEIMDNCCCVESLENEVLKLLCLFSNCMANVTHEGEQMLSRKYVIEKVSRLLQGIPIILDANARGKYVRIRMESRAGLPPRTQEDKE